MAPAAEAALARARHLLAADAGRQADGQAMVAGTPVAPAADDTLALAWRLKDLCLAAWAAEPARAVQAAEVLQALSTAGPQAGLTTEQARTVTALAHWVGGLAHVIHGRMAEAVQGFDAAAAGLRAAGLPDPAAQTQIAKIMALSMLGQHAEAAACGVAAQQELLALGNLRAAARVSQNLGGLQLRCDEYAAAAQHCRQAAVLFARLGDHVHSVLADIGLAAALTSMGDFDEAQRIHARARMRAGNQGLEMQLALVDESEALLHLARGRYRDALAGLESARRRYEALAVPHYLAVAEKQLADAYLELRLLPEAWVLFDAAVAKFAKLALPDEQAWALAQRGRTESLLGQAQADASFAQAAALFAAQGNAVGGASVALARAELALAGADATGALRWAQQAEAGMGAAGQADGQARAQVLCAQAQLLAGHLAEAGTGFAAALQAAQVRQQLQVQVRCHTGLGQVAQAQGDAPAASAAFEAAIALFEDQRRALPGDDIRRAFLTDHLRPYQERLRMALASGSGPATLVQLERLRARSLDDRLSEASAAAPDDDDEAVAMRERLNWLYRHLQRLADEGGGSALLSAELVQTEQALLERARRQRLAFGQAADQPGGPGATGGDFDPAALQAVLRPGDALVQYGVLDDELFACVLTPGGVQLQRHLAPWPAVLDALRSARFQMESLRHGAQPLASHLARLTERMRQRLAQVHALVWQPLLPALAGCQRLLLVPQAQLGWLPFAALSDGQPDGLPLGQQHQLAVVPSARAALRGLQRPPVSAHSVQAFGESSQLPFAAAEAQRVAGLFSQGRAHLGPAASLHNLRAHAGAADVLHLACHAQFRGDNPRFSALHLADGVLTVDQAEALALKPCTVVLSACETGLADGGTGDEMVGLVRAFLVAGAARVLASHWPVDDAVTQDFMRRFYQALVAGHTPAAALQRAQADIRSLHPHPSFWAAFALYGGW